MTKPQEAGTRFPFINLEKALGRAGQLFEADPRGRPVALQTAFTAWNYSDKSSGGHQTVAALKMYGLVSDTGANADRRISLTQDALQYFRDEREEERSKALRRFALAPKLVSAVWEDWDGNPPSDNIARSHLKIDRNLNEQSARSFLSIYKDNLAFANLGGSGTVQASAPETADTSDADQAQDREPASVGDQVQWSPDGVDQFPQPARVRAVSPDCKWVFVDGSETGIPMTEVNVVAKGSGQRTPPPPPSMGFERPPTLPLQPLGSNMKRDVFSLDEGEVTITFPATLTQASYNDLVDWLDLVKRKAERAISKPAGPFD